jgi:predicted RNA-binding Zn-ribbon protein involved in translation (DUF1610 family)
MLMTELPRLGGERTSVVPPCPSCGRPMHLTRTAPRSDALPDWCVFKCGECGVWITESAKERRVL